MCAAYETKNHSRSNGNSAPPHTESVLLPLQYFSTSFQGFEVLLSFRLIASIINTNMECTAIIIISTQNQQQLLQIKIFHTPLCWNHSNVNNEDNWALGRLLLRAWDADGTTAGLPDHLFKNPDRMMPKNAVMLNALRRSWIGGLGSILTCSSPSGARNRAQDEQENDFGACCNPKTASGK